MPLHARLSAILVLCAGVCAFAQPPADATGAARAAIAARCAGCHGSEATRVRGHFGFITDLPRLAADPKYIAPGQPEDSFLWQQIDDGEMPPPDSKTGQLSPDERAAIYTWILAAAPAQNTGAAPGKATAPVQDTSVSARRMPPSAEPAVRRPEGSRLARAAAYLGRFHVLIIHFPIAFLVAAAGAELWNVIRPSPQALSAARLLLGLGVVAAIVAAPLGWLNAIDWDGGSLLTLNLHRWIGTGAGALAPLAFYLSERDARRTVRRPATRAAVILLAVTAGVAAHFGGMLVYGSSYFVP